MRDRRSVTTILFTDIVGSTERAAELGDHEWRRLQAQHHARVRIEVRRFGGREVDTAYGVTPTRDSSRSSRTPRWPSD